MKLILTILAIFLLSACAVDYEGEEKNDTKILENEEKIELDINSCFSDDDCVQRVFCGCHTIEYTNKRIEEANKMGISYDACTHPPFSYCVCEDNQCQQLIDKEARIEKAEKFTINNSQINNIPNLINYDKEEILNAEIDFEDVYFIWWPISVNQEILTDKDIDVINVNLPRDINILLERTEYIESQNSWRGKIINDDDRFNKGDTIFISVSEDGILFTIRNYQIKGENYSYTITSNNIRVR